MDPTSLLPIRCVRLRFCFTTDAHLRFFHQPLVAGLLRNLMEGELKEEPRLWLEATDSGRVPFHRSDGYCFELYCCAGAEDLLDALVGRLRGLPGTLPEDKRGLELGGNLRCVAAEDAHDGRPFRDAGSLSPYDMAALAQEVAHYCREPVHALRFTAPARLLRAKPDRDGRKGEGRYVHDRGELSGDLLGRRIADSLVALGKAVGDGGLAAPLPIEVLDDDIGWYDGAYYDLEGQESPVGGILGCVRLRVADAAALPALVLGQYLGIGQRRTFGFGRYRLESATGESTRPRRRPSRGVLARAAEPGNLEAAYIAIRDNRAGRHRRDWEDEDLAALAWAEEPGPVDAMLDQIADALRRNRYEPAELVGRILRQPGKAPRPLAVPPFADRVAQRAVLQVLGRDVEPLMSAASFGYRRGLSRLNARDRLQSLRREGYDWLYEADIDDFFDSVSHSRLAARLRSLLPDEPAMGLLLRWAAAPVCYRGHRLERAAGLPQGAPVSPLLANLMLDDFDADLEALGFRLVRYADDFVIACRSRAEAEAAAERVRRSLAEVDLRLNEGKSGITHFNDGFHFLGYTFLGDLVVERHREKKGPVSGALRVEDLPPASWLARLAAQHPEVLSDQPPAEAAVALPGAKDPVERVRPRAETSSDEPCTLLVVTEGSRISTSNGRLRVAMAEGHSHEQPLAELGAVLLIGRQSITGPALTAALQARVPVHFATRGGRYLGLLSDGGPGQAGHGLWLRQQRCFGDSATALSLARELIAARIYNQGEVLRQRARGDARLQAPLAQLRAISRRVEQATGRSMLNGIEGLAARHYFGAIALLLPEELGFEGRRRRPPPDPFNALLSLGYTLLYQRVDSVVRSAGLLPWQGFYHEARGTHAALASDLMEPFRHLVERQALSMIRRNELGRTDFVVEPDSGCRLSRRALRAYVSALSSRFVSVLDDAAAGERGTLYEHLWRMARGLVAVIDGRAPGFAAFRIR